MKLICLITGLIVSFSVYSQRKDTFDIHLSRYDVNEFLTYELVPLDTSDNYILNKQVCLDSIDLVKFNLYVDSLEIIWQNSYCRFYVNGVISEAGTYVYGALVGDYKKYFDGQVIEEGFLSERSIKVGCWRYNIKGKEFEKCYDKERLCRIVHPDKEIRVYDSKSQLITDLVGGYICR